MNADRGDGGVRDRGQTNTALPLTIGQKSKTKMRNEIQIHEIEWIAVTNFRGRKQPTKYHRTVVLVRGSILNWLAIELNFTFRCVSHSRMRFVFCVFLFFCVDSLLISENAIDFLFAPCLRTEASPHRRIADNWVWALVCMQCMHSSKQPVHSHTHTTITNDQLKFKLFHPIYCRCTVIVLCSLNILVALLSSCFCLIKCRADMYVWLQTRLYSFVRHSLICHSLQLRAFKFSVVTTTKKCLDWN